MENITSQINNKDITQSSSNTDKDISREITNKMKTPSEYFTLISTLLPL